MIRDEVNILHCADLHLGSDIRTLGEKGDIRRQEIFRTFEAIIDLCRQDAVDFLLIAGDFFDRIHVPAKLVDEVLHLIASIPETVVAIAPGNHDPYSVDSCYHLRAWPSNAVIFNGPLSFRRYPEKGVCLWGGGFDCAYASDLWNAQHSGIDVDPGVLNIAIMHGDLAAQSPQSRYNPIPSEFFAGTGMDYVALGHVHKRTPIVRSGKTFYAYSGCPDGRGFDERGALGVYIGAVGRGYHKLRFQPIASREFREETIEISGFTSNAALADDLLEEMGRRHPDRLDRDLFKIIVTGSLPRSAVIDPQGIAEKLSRSMFYVKIEDATGVAVDYASLADENSLKGIFVRKMLDRLAQRHAEEKALCLQKGLKIGLDAFDGEVKIDEYYQDFD
jgi:DNA repair protein SbcD/Mre11